MRHWAAGDVIVRRDVWKGRPWFGEALVVVQDEPGLLAAYRPTGAPFGFPDGCWPGGRHPWHGRAGWEGEGVLLLHRPGDAYSVWVFWTAAPRRFAGWYVNLETPFRRTVIGIDTFDHELDLWSADGKTWHRKDDELLERRVAEGLFGAGDARAIRAECARLERELRECGPWWDRAWAKWQPDARWPRPALPPEWHLAAP